jgi:hypothetical protein
MENVEYTVNAFAEIAANIKNQKYLNQKFAVVV